MINSRSLVRIQWFAILALIIAYIFKPIPPCPDIKPATRTVYVTLHDSTPKKDTVPARKTGIRKRIKEMYVAPPANIAQTDTGGVTCDEYLATTSDSSVDIEVRWCSTSPVDSVEITHRLKGIKEVHIIDSIPYAVGVRRGIYLGATLSKNAFGPRVDIVNQSHVFSYTYDAVQKQHQVGASFRIFGY